MQILKLSNVHFSGHGAGRIKALYMQNSSYPAQVLVYDELRNIGKRHNFDVFIHNDDELCTGPISKPSDKNCIYQLWSQDNKTILNKGGKTVLISGLYMPKEEQAAAENLAKLKNVKHEQPELFLEGGNFFLGKKPDNSRYLIIGYKDIHYSAIHYYLKHKLGDVTQEDIEKFVDDLKLQDCSGNVFATYDEFEEDFDTWGKIALIKIQEAFDVERDNITILSQGQYHNDLVIRPLDYPYVLVNDEKMSLENLEKLSKKFKFGFSKTKLVQDLKKKIKEQEEEYVTSDKICEELEEKGFVPIKIGGCYGLSTINFINAIVHQNGPDLVYITNSGESGNKYYEYLQKLFENDVKKNCPQIKDVYFVKGAKVQGKSNIILEYLKRYRGGIHCLCCEEMKE